MLLRLFSAGSIPAGGLITHGEFGNADNIGDSTDKDSRVSLQRDGKGVHHLQGGCRECSSEDADLNVKTEKTKMLRMDAGVLGCDARIPMSLYVRVTLVVIHIVSTSLFSDL
jgi:hypothetical protein